MKRSDVEACVRHIYSVRNLNDAEKAADLFAPGAVFQLAGSAGPARIAVKAEGPADMRELMGSLVAAWEWISHDIKDVVIDGDRAAVHYHTRQRFIPTNQIVETELFDLVTFEDGKIARLVEFCDTALASDLISAAMTQAAGKLSA